MSVFGKIYVASSRVSAAFGRYLLPALSPLGADVVSSPGALLAHDWQQLHFISGSLCSCCGRPLEPSLLTDIRCAPCEIKQPRIIRTRSALEYTELSRQLILNFKYGGRADNIQSFASWMYGAASDILQPPGVLVPVPLHLFRRMKRTFNQSALLAGALARITKLPHHPNWLVRHRNTPIQGFLSGAGRAKNVNGAFRVPQRSLPALQGKRIILIDDVRTSGATLDACAQTLLMAGAGAVDAVTLSRVVKAVEPTT